MRRVRRRLFCYRSVIDRQLQKGFYKFVVARLDSLPSEVFSAARTNVRALFLQKH